MRDPEEQAFLDSVPADVLTRFMHEVLPKEFICSNEDVFTTSDWVNVWLLKSYMETHAPRQPAIKIEEAEIQIPKNPGPAIKVDARNHSQALKNTSDFRVDIVDNKEVYVLISDDEEPEAQSERAESESGLSDADADGSSVVSEGDLTRLWPKKTGHPSVDHGEDSDSDIEFISESVSHPQQITIEDDSDIEIKSESGSEADLDTSRSTSPSTDASHSGSWHIPSPTRWLDPDLNPRLYIPPSDEQVIEITREVRVMRLEYLKPTRDLPSVYPIHKIKTAIVVDMQDQRFRQYQKNGKLFPLEVMIKKAESDSWNGPNGGSDNKPELPLTILDEKADDPSETVTCRRHRGHCAGIRACESADTTSERYELDTAGRDGLLAMQRKRSMEDQSSAALRLAVFWNIIQSELCKAKNANNEACDGKPMMRKFRKGNVRGMTHFVGCTGWTPENSGHRFHYISPGVDETELLHVMKTGKFRSTVPNTSPCGYIVSNGAGLKVKYCPFAHVIDGQPVLSKIVAHACPAYRTIFVPVDEEAIRKVVIIYKPIAHNHPVPCISKVPVTSRNDYAQCANAVGIRKATPLKVDNAPSTALVLGGMRPSEFHAGLMRDRVKADIIRAEKRKVHPCGNGLPGVQAEFDHEQTLPLDSKDRYIQYIQRGVNEPVIIVTSNGTVLNRVHNALCLHVDTSFKRTKGPINEWEATILDSELNRPLTIARVYCDSKTEACYKAIFDKLQDIVLTITGKRLGFKRLHEGGNLLTLNVDLETAQVLGFMESLFATLPAGTGIKTSLDVAKRTVRACLRHIKAPLKDFQGLVTAEDYEHLRRDFPHCLKSQEKLDEFTQFVHSLKQEAITAWWDHKLNNGPWIIPAILGPPFSHISPEDWAVSDTTTNINESQHHATNLNTDIGLSLLDAILGAKEFDAKVAKEIELTLQQGTAKKSSELKHRLKSSNQRAATAAKKRKENAVASGIKEQIKDLKGQLDAMKSSGDASSSGKVRAPPAKKRAAPAESSSGRVKKSKKAQNEDMGQESSVASTSMQPLNKETSGVHSQHLRPSTPPALAQRILQSPGRSANYPYHHVPGDYGTFLPSGSSHSQAGTSMNANMFYTTGTQQYTQWTYPPADGAHVNAPSDMDMAFIDEFCRRAARGEIEFSS